MRSVIKVDIRIRSQVDHTGHLKRNSPKVRVFKRVALITACPSPRHVHVHVHVHIFTTRFSLYFKITLVFSVLRF